MGTTTSLISHSRSLSSKSNASQSDIHLHGANWRFACRVTCVKTNPDRRAERLFALHGAETRKEAARLLIMWACLHHALPSVILNMSVIYETIIICIRLDCGDTSM